MYVHFLEFEKTFHSVHSDSLCLISQSYGTSFKMICMVKALYNDFECDVVDEEDTTEWFKIRTGVKQGCNTLSLLFLLVVD